MRAYIDRSFARTVQLPGNFQFLQKIVGRLECAVLHVLNWMMDLAMGVAVLRAPGRAAPVINAFNDRTTVFATEANLVARFGEGRAKLDLACGRAYRFAPVCMAQSRA